MVDRGVKKQCRKIEYVMLPCFFLWVLISLSRYCMQGEPRIVMSDDTAWEECFLYDGMEIRQPLTITEVMDWRQGSYGLQFVIVASESAGKICCCLQQEQKIIEEAELTLQELSDGFVTLPLDFTKLHTGEAKLILTTQGVTERELSLAYGRDYYGFGEVLVNGEKQSGQTLMQKYAYHIQGREYTVRLICYGIVLFCMIGMCFLVIGREESKARCYAAFGILSIAFLAMFYIYDSSVMIEPTYAEAVTNFMKYARENSFLQNLLITDAGYLPLFPRLITLFFIKVLRLPAADALYFMQMSACILCCMMWAFFCLKPFEKYFSLSFRIVISMLIMTVCFYQETLFFTNFSYWGILPILLFMISDMKQWSKTEFWLITGVCSLYCLSKGSYVILLPFMMIYLLFFYKELERRHKIYGFCIAGAAFLQLLYSFSGQGDGGNWIRAEELSNPVYLLQLICRICTDMLGSFCSFLGKGILKCGAVFGVAAVFSILLCLLFFVQKIVMPKIRKEIIEEKWISIYAILLFMAMNAAFYRVTAKAGSITWQGALKAAIAPLGNKYEIFGSVAGLLLFILLLQIGKQKGKEWGIFILTAAFCVTAPVLQWKDLGKTTISDSRIYEGNLNVCLEETKELIDREAFFLPVRGDWWSYSKNVTVYQIGTENYYEESQGVNLDIMEQGYWSAYTLKEEMPAENLLEVWINRPNRLPKEGELPYRLQLFDAQGQLLAETEALGSTGNKKIGFVLETPVNGVKTMQFIDGAGNSLYTKDYLCYVSAY